MALHDTILKSEHFIVIVVVVFLNLRLLRFSNCLTDLHRLSSKSNTVARHATLLPHPTTLYTFTIQLSLNYYHILTLCSASLCFYIQSEFWVPSSVLKLYRRLLYRVCLGFVKTFCRDFGDFSVFAWCRYHRKFSGNVIELWTSAGELLTNYVIWKSAR